MPLTCQKALRTVLHNQHIALLVRSFICSSQEGPLHQTLACIVYALQKDPPVPEVDPDNAEFVIFVRAGKVCCAVTASQVIEVLYCSQSVNLVLVKDCKLPDGGKSIPRSGL